jgi:hypothetical protein
MLLRISRPVLVTAFSKDPSGEVYARAHALAAGLTLAVRQAGDAADTFQVDDLGWVQLPRASYELFARPSAGPPCG